MEKEDLRGVPAAIGVVVLAFLFSGVVLAIYPGWEFISNFIKNNIIFNLDGSDVLFNLLLGIVSGIFSGWVTGVLITRINRFSSIKSEALGHLNSIEYIGDHIGVESVDLGTFKQIRELANDLYRFHHKSAGDAFDAVYSEIAWEGNLFMSGDSSIEGFEKLLAKCRKNIRDSRPSLKVLLPWGSI